MRQEEREERGEYRAQCVRGRKRRVSEGVPLLFHHLLLLILSSVRPRAQCLPPAAKGPGGSLASQAPHSTAGISSPAEGNIPMAVSLTLLQPAQVGNWHREPGGFLNGKKTSLPRSDGFSGHSHFMHCRKNICTDQYTASTMDQMLKPFPHRFYFQTPPQLTTCRSLFCFPRVAPYYPVTF